ncbi:hypothetical protein CBW53_19560 [Yersinia frederiksenii]|nr:hypothetical protein CBW53_19560 [Yersinia frederiksenii]
MNLQPCVLYSARIFKGIFDWEGTLGEKQTISRHKNITQTARYDRKVEAILLVRAVKWMLYP